MPSDREARRDAYVAKARAELAALASEGVCMSGNSFSSVLFAKGELNAGEKDGRPSVRRAIARIRKLGRGTSRIGGSRLR